jgi:CRISPR-associated protein Cmr3
VEGVPDGWAKACPRLIALGGESRMAELEVTGPVAAISAPLEAIKKDRRVTITLLTPLRLTSETMPRAGETFANWPGVRVESACLGKPNFLGGWDAKKRQSFPLRPYLPAGSTWFCTVDADHVQALSERHDSRIGSEGAFGFGAVALGIW